MTAQENHLLTQQLTTSADSKYSGINVNVNGGNVCLLINQDINNEKVWTLVGSVTKTKLGKLSRFKGWILKKFTTSAEDVTTPIQKSSCDASEEFPGENNILTAEENLLKKRVTPDTEDEFSSSVLAEDDCRCYHSMSCRKFENRANQTEPTCRSITHKQEKDKTPATKDKFSRSVSADDKCVSKHSMSCVKFENRANKTGPTYRSITHEQEKDKTPATKDEFSRSVLADDECVSNHSMFFSKFENRANKTGPTTQSPTYKKEEDKGNADLFCTVNGRSSLFFDTNDTNENVSEFTDVKQLIMHQENLHLHCGPENSSHLSLEPLKVFTEEYPVDKSYNNKDKSVNVESPDPVKVWCETSFTSGYPSSRNSELEKKEGCENDLSFEVFQSKTSDEDEERKLNNLSSIEENSFQTKSSDADKEIKLTRKSMSDSLVADDVRTCPASCSSRNTEEVPIGNQNEKFRHSTFLSSCDVVVVSHKKKTHSFKKRYRKKCKKSDSASWNENLFDDSIPSGCHFSFHLAHKPRRRYSRPETTDPLWGNNSNLKQSSSNFAISGICASLDHDTFSWYINNVNREVTDHPKMKKKIKLRQCNKFFSNQQKKKVKSIVKELRVDHRCLPFPHFGLGSYFDRLNNGSPPSLQEQMRYEWIRLASFQHYTGAGNTLNLARNGFYHRHTDGPTSTRCAYCDQTHSNWEYFDNIETVHRQISPNCPFHGDRSEESLNVSINCDGPRSSSSEAANQNSEPSTSENSAVKTYILKPSLNLASAVDEVARGLENTSVSQEKPSKTNRESVSQQPTEDPEGRERRTGERVSGLTRTSSNAALPPVSTESRSNRSNRAQAGAGNFVDKHAPQTPAPVNRDSTPTTLENVKHPEYRTMAQRVNSFQGFPEYLDQTPEQMALAGFYFVGVADFTRCFCCGGGLRNWEAGDDPLLEHTRWFPRCEYVLRLKGERYVAAVQRRHQEHMEQQRRQQIEIANQRDANRNSPDPMTTDAASVMREMGYADQRIRETILAVRRQIGTHMITTQQVLSWLLDQDDDSTTTTAASSVYQTGHETNSIYTGINMASEEDDSNYTTAAPSSTNTTVSTTAVKTRESVQGSGSNNATATSSGNGNQQTDTKSTAPGADASLGPSSQTGAKRNGKKKKAKGNTKTGQPAGTPGGPGTDAARKLQAENEKLRDMQTCKVCMERPVNTTMLPCGHLVCCDICASRLRDCPVCRKRIKGTVKTFMS